MYHFSVMTSATNRIASLPQVVVLLLLDPSINHHAQDFCHRTLIAKDKFGGNTRKKTVHHHCIHFIVVPQPFQSFMRIGIRFAPEVIGWTVSRLLSHPFSMALLPLNYEPLT